MYRLLALLLPTSLSLAAESLPADLEPKQCSSCAAWNEPVDPFLLAPNTWYVGSRGLSAVLIDSGDGLVLLDGGLPQSAPAIATSIRRLGYRVEDLRFILNSHAHFDHAGGIAALARWSGAEVLASESGATALRRGDVDADDAQAGFGDFNRFPPLPAARGLGDGEVLLLGSLDLTIHYTPGHTPGSASYSWPACDAKGECQTVVYADSVTAVSAPGYRFSERPTLVNQFNQSIARLGDLACDVVVSTHPEFTDLFGRRDRAALLDPEGCRRYADQSAERLSKRLASERAS